MIFYLFGFFVFENKKPSEKNRGMVEKWLLEVALEDKKSRHTIRYALILLVAGGRFELPTFGL